MQDLNIHAVISDSFVKHDKSKVPTWYFLIFNTYTTALVSLIFGLIALLKNKFYPFGLICLVSILIMFITWLIYWFLM